MKPCGLNNSLRVVIAVSLSILFVKTASVMFALMSEPEDLAVFVGIVVLVGTALCYWGAIYLLWIRRKREN